MRRIDPHENELLDGGGAGGPEVIATARGASREEALQRLEQRLAERLDRVDEAGA